MENVMGAKRAWIAAAIEDGITIPGPAPLKPFVNRKILW